MSFDVQQGEFVALVGPSGSGKTSMLANRLDHYPSELSGGQQQRAAIARALIHEQNQAGIMVTHDPRMARYVDKVIQMKDGKINRIIEDRAEIDALAERVD